VDHVPRVWILDSAGELEAQALPFETNVFDLTGRVVDAADGAVVAREIESAFVTLLQAESPTELKRSGDGSIVRDEIEVKFAQDGTPDVVKAIVRSLLGEAVERHAQS
jgi:hypothetical protein